jgi:hypothetical protein
MNPTPATVRNAGPTRLSHPKRRLRSRAASGGCPLRSQMTAPDQRLASRGPWHLLACASGRLP